MKVFNSILPSKLRNSEFGINTLFYSSSSFVTGAISFILITVLTKFLSKEDFGIIENFNAIVALLSGIILWGNDFTIIQYYKDGSKKDEYLRALNIIITQSLIFFSLSLFINVSFLKVSQNVVIYAVIFSFITALSQLINISFQYEKRAKHFAFVTIANSLLGFIVNILFVYFIRNYNGRIWATILSSSLIFIFIFIPFYKQKIIAFKLRLDYLKGAYIVGIPFFVGLITGWAIEKINRFMISDMLSLDETGVFGVGYQFGSIVLIIKAAITRAWMPYVIENSIANKLAVKKMFVRLIFAFAFLAFFVSILSYIYIQYFIDKNFIRAQYIVPFIAFGYFFDGIWSLLVNIIVFEKHYKVYSTITIISGLSNIVLNYLFIPIWGIQGSAIATLLTFAIGAFCSFLYVKFYLKWFKNT